MRYPKAAAVALLALVTLAVTAPAQSQAQAQETGDQAGPLGVKVMTQNLYIGADIDRFLQGEDPSAVFGTALESNFPSRAAELARQIAGEQPDLIGLQDVTRIEVTFGPGGPVVDEIDYLDILLSFLGDSYEESSTVINADVTLPIGDGLFARVVDRDVILNRADIETRAPFSDNFSTNFVSDFGGIPIEFTRGWTAVDAEVDGKWLRFVNTHLEVQNAPCFTPELVFCQEVQAAELVDALYFEPLPIVLVGDFNAERGEATYQEFKDRGYGDTWNGSLGSTCCQPELLNNVESMLDQRIDLVWYRKRLTKLVAADTKVIASRAPLFTPDGTLYGFKWYSDHGGVVADLDLNLINSLPDGEIDPGDIGDD